MFIGFVIGTICVIGLARALARRRGYGGVFPYGYAYGFGGPPSMFGRRHCAPWGHRDGWRQHGWGHDAWGHHRAWHDGPPWQGGTETAWGHGRNVVQSMLGRLDATPSQEKAIFAALDELKAEATKLRGAGSEVRSDVARAIRGSLLDDVALESATARIDDASLALRAAVRKAVAKIHEALDDRQRKMLADMIDSSWRGGW